MTDRHPSENHKPLLVRVPRPHGERFRPVNCCGAHCAFGYYARCTLYRFLYGNRYLEQQQR